MARVNTELQDGRVYTGSPRDLINTISQEITDALNRAGTHASPIHALALLHVAASLIKQVNAGQIEGRAPSFKSILSTVMRGIDGGKWTDAELKEFDEDFCGIVESLGGYKLGARQSTPNIMSPTLGVH